MKLTVDNSVSSKPGSVHCQTKKGQHMLVKVAPMGETVTEVNVETGSTVADILDIANVDDNGRAITVNNTPASLDTQVTAENSVISLANKMKGGM